MQVDLLAKIFWIMFTVGTVDVMSTEYRSIFRWRTSTEYRSYVGGISVNCRWYVGQLSVAYRSTIGRISVVCHMYRQITGRYIGQVSVKYRPIIGEVSAKCRPSVCEVSVTWKLYRPTYISTDYRLTIHRLSTECRPSVDRQSTECRSTVDRQSIECRSTVDRVSIECRPLRRPI